MKSDSNFKGTRWSLVFKAQNNENPMAQKALNELCEIYWYPIYAYIRRRGFNPVETEDLTQSYFASLLAREYLDKADKERGKLRQFLLADIKLFLFSERRKNRTLKKGNNVVHIPIDQGWAEESYHCEPSEKTTPEKLFERRWALTVLERALIQVKAHYKTKEKLDLFENLQQYLYWNSDGAKYSDLATRLGRSESDIKINVFRLRKLYKENLEREVSETLNEGDDLQEEIRYLAGVLSSL